MSKSSPFAPRPSTSTTTATPKSKTTPIVLPMDSDSDEDGDSITLVDTADITARMGEHGLSDEPLTTTIPLAKPEVKTANTSNKAVDWSTLMYRVASAVSKEMRSENITAYAAESVNEAAFNVFFRLRLRDELDRAHGPGAYIVSPEYILPDKSLKRVDIAIFDSSRSVNATPVAIVELKYVPLGYVIREGYRYTTAVKSSASATERTKQTEAFLRTIDAFIRDELDTVAAPGTFSYQAPTTKASTDFSTLWTAARGQLNSYADILSKQPGSVTPDNFLVIGVGRKVFVY